MTHILALVDSLYPLESLLPLTAGFFLLSSALFTYTYSGWPARAVCATIGLPALACFFCLAYGSYPSSTQTSALARSSIGWYGAMRTIDCCFIGLADAHPPQLVKIDTGERVPFPTTFFGRVAYALDLCMSVRGTSWFPGCNWDWITRSVQTLQAQLPTSRRAFMHRELFSFMLQYLMLDIFDSLNKSRVWDKTVPHPITSLPIHEKFLFTLSLSCSIVLSMTIPYSIMAIIAVACGSPPTAWPPLFDKPFTAASLAELWSRRWHAVFRRVFDRISSVLWPKNNRILRTAVVFALSAGLHVVLMNRLEFGTAKFFLLQPVCLLVESMVLIPLARRTLPPLGQIALTRAWAWVSLLWTGSYWTDVWVRRGFWDPTERLVFASLVRGLSHGRWLMV